MPRRFTPRVQAFIDRMDEHGQKQRAAIEAGFSERSAHSRANKLMHDPDVKTEIERRAKAREERCRLNKDAVLEELRKLVFADPRRLFNPDGSPRAISELDDDTAKCIAGLEVLEEWEGTGRDRKFVGFVRKYKLVDKNSAIDKAMRHLSLYNDKLKLEGFGELAEKMACARSRIKKK